MSIFGDVGDFVFGNGKDTGVLPMGQERFTPYDVNKDDFKNPNQAQDRGMLQGGYAQSENRQAPTMGGTQLAPAATGTSTNVGPLERMSAANATASNAAPIERATAAQTGPIERANLSTMNAATINRGEDQQMRDYQLGLADSLRAQANGNGVGQDLAARAYKTSNDQNVRNMMGVLAANGGNGSPAIAQKQMLDNAHAVEATNAAALSADKMKAALDAQGLLNNVASGARGQDIGVNTSQAGLDQGASENNMNAANDISKFNSQSANEAANRNADRSQSASIFNAGQNTQNNQFNSGQNTDVSKFNAGNQTGASQFNAGQTNTGQFANQSAANAQTLANLAAKNANILQQGQMDLATKQANLEAQLKQQGYNDDMAKFYATQLLAQDEADRQAMMGYDQLNTEQNLGLSGLDQKAYDSAANRKGGVVGGIAQAGTSMLLPALSDAREKKNVAAAAWDQGQRATIDHAKALSLLTPEELADHDSELADALRAAQANVPNRAPEPGPVTPEQRNEARAIAAVDGGRMLSFGRPVKITGAPQDVVGPGDSMSPVDQKTNIAPAGDAKADWKKRIEDMKIKDRQFQDSKPTAHQQLGHALGQALSMPFMMLQKPKDKKAAPPPGPDSSPIMANYLGQGMSVPEVEQPQPMSPVSDSDAAAMSGQADDIMSGFNASMANGPSVGGGAAPPTWGVSPGGAGGEDLRAPSMSPIDQKMNILPAGSDPFAGGMVMSGGGLDVMGSLKGTSQLETGGGRGNFGQGAGGSGQGFIGGLLAALSDEREKENISPTMTMSPVDQKTNITPALFGSSSQSQSAAPQNSGLTSTMFGFQGDNTVSGITSPNQKNTPATAWDAMGGGEKKDSSSDLGNAGSLLGSSSSGSSFGSSVGSSTPTPPASTSTAFDVAAPNNGDFGYRPNEQRQGYVQGLQQNQGTLGNDQADMWQHSYGNYRPRVDQGPAPALNRAISDDQIQESFGSFQNQIAALQAQLAAARQSHPNPPATPNTPAPAAPIQNSAPPVSAAPGAPQPGSPVYTAPAPYEANYGQVDPTYMGSGGQQGLYGTGPTQSNDVRGATAYTPAPVSYENQPRPIGANQMRSMSDKRQKEKITELNDDVINDFIDKLQAYTYDYKNPNLPGAGQGRQLGVMAQDLEKHPIGKSAVKEVNGIKMVDYGKLGGINMAGWAIEHKHNDQQDDRIANLEHALKLLSS